MTSPPTLPASDTFYRAFEDHFRGSRDTIKDRLRVYLPYIQPLAQLRPQYSVLDIGCGRGEWLELLLQHRISAQGIDQDAGMLQACRGLGLQVTQGDAIAHLHSQPTASLLAVTGFHIAEHLPFDTLQDLYHQAHRALIPGGLLILETPNPENLQVGTSHFYTDPTHQRPLPSALLVFLAQHHGFASAAVLRLQESAALATGPVHLHDVLVGVSPDYSVVAQKQQVDEKIADLIQTMAPLLSVPRGLTLQALAQAYDTQHEQAQQQAIQQAIQQVVAPSLLACQAAQELAAQTLQQSQTEIARLNTELQNLQSSWSWRITQPLRHLTRLLRR